MRILQCESLFVRCAELVTRKKFPGNDLLFVIVKTALSSSNQSQLPGMYETPKVRPPEILILQLTQLKVYWHFFPREFASLKRTKAYIIDQHA